MDDILNSIKDFLAQYWAIILFVVVLILLIKAKHKIKKAVSFAIRVDDNNHASDALLKGGIIQLTENDISEM